MEVLTKQPSAKGPAEMFAGDVWLDVIAKGDEPSRMRVNAVPFGEWRWHGAVPGDFMTHIAMWEAPDEGPETKWGAHVTDAEYPGAEREAEPHA